MCDLGQVSHPHQASSSPSVQERREAQGPFPGWRSAACYPQAATKASPALWTVSGSVIIGLSGHTPVPGILTASWTLSPGIPLGRQS